jgi:hypothetical protein
MPNERTRSMQWASELCNDLLADRLDEATLRRHALYVDRHFLQPYEIGHLTLACAQSKWVARMSEARAQALLAFFKALREMKGGMRTLQEAKLDAAKAVPLLPDRAELILFAKVFPDMFSHPDYLNP